MTVCFQYKGLLKAETQAGRSSWLLSSRPPVITQLSRPASSWLQVWPHPLYNELEGLLALRDLE